MKNISDIYLTTIGAAPTNVTKKNKIVMLEKRRTTLEEKFIETLSDEQRKMFETFMGAYMDVCAMENEDSFKRGFSIGAKITAEAFIIENEL